jgi:hypothetical protein
MLEATNNGLFIGEKMVTPRTVECGRRRLRVCSKRCRPFLHRLWPATSSSKRLHDIGKLVQKSLHTRELFPRFDVVKQGRRLVGSAAAAFPFAPFRFWTRLYHG